ncbi:MAG TPA: hydroxysqualene dehydroxylase HpnE [Acidimicrobiales bacterium]|nr:hydroxysqualene dehydroxylase HpnE [Acidimicrobiales bacterium]
MKPTSIGVIGGGLAGIAAALALVDANEGVEVSLLERRPHLGGLTTSIERDGLSFDNGQHVFLGCCTAYRALIERFGATDQVYLQPRLDVPVLSTNGTRSSITRSRLRAPFHLMSSLMRYRHLSIKDRLLLGRAFLALRRLDLEDPSLDSVTFGDWLRRHGQSQRAIDRLWNLIIQPTINVTADESTLALAAQVFQVGFLESSDGADIGWSVVPLATLHGSNAERTLKEAGVKVLLNASAHAITPRNDGGFAVHTGGEEFSYDVVVVATAPNVAATLGALGSDAHIAERLGTSPIVNIHFVLDRKVTDLKMAACLDSPIEFLFDRSDASGVTTGQCLAISLSAADKYIGIGTSELVPLFFDALGELFPQARDAQLVSSFVTREHAATFRATPGIESLRPSSTTARPGLFLAGAWCNTGWPATMEGAIRSGNEAAAQVLRFVSGTGSADTADHERVRT